MHFYELWAMEKKLLMKQNQRNKMNLKNKKEFWVLEIRKMFEREQWMFFCKPKHWIWSQIFSLFFYDHIENIIALGQSTRFHLYGLKTK